MSDKLEVGQVWVHKSCKEEKEILFIGEEKVFYLNKSLKSELILEKNKFMQTHTLKKPEPKLVKLVAFIDKKDGELCFIEKENCESSGKIKKQIIIKDNELFIEE